MTDSRKRRRPAPGEFADFYAGYIGHVPDGDIIDLLRTGLGSVLDVFSGIPEEKHDFRYAPGKWSAKEVLGHALHHERVIKEQYL